MRRLTKLSLAELCRNVILLVGMVLLIFLGIDILFRVQGVSLWAQWLPQWVAVSKLDFWPMLVLGVLCVVLPFFYLITTLLAASLSRGIVGRGKEGDDICLTPNAIERAIVREVRAAVPEVVGVRSCEAVQGRRRARVTLNVAVSEQSPVPNVQSRVKQSAQDTLVRLIGYADGSQVRVKVSRIVGGAPKARKKRPRPNGAARRKELPQDTQ